MSERRQLCIMCLITKKSQTLRVNSRTMTTRGYVGYATEEAFGSATCRFPTRNFLVNHRLFLDTNALLRKWQANFLVPSNSYTDWLSRSGGAFHD